MRRYPKVVHSLSQGSTKSRAKRRSTRKLFAVDYADMVESSEKEGTISSSTASNCVLSMSNYPRRIPSSRLGLSL